MAPYLTTAFLDERLGLDATNDPAPPGPGLIAAYRLDEGAGTVVTDAGPNHLDGHFPIGPAASGDSPVFYAGGYMDAPAWGGSGLQMNGTQGFDLPAQVIPGGDCTVYALLTPDPVNAARNCAVLGWSGTSSNGAYFGLHALDGTPMAGEDVVTPFQGGIKPWYGGAGVVVWTYKAGGAAAAAGNVYLGTEDQSGWLGQDPTPTDAAFAQAGPQNYVWGGAWYPLAAGYVGGYHGLAVFAGTHTPSQVSANVAWFHRLAQAKGIALGPLQTPPEIPLIGILGDSIAASVKDTGLPWGSPHGGSPDPQFWWRQVRTALAGTYTWLNRAVGGLTTLQVQAVAVAAYQALLAGRLMPSVTLIQSGHNNAYDSTADMDALIVGLHAAGSTYVILETGLPSAAFGAPTEAARQAWNTHYRAYNPGSWFKVADSGGDGTIGVPWNSGLLAYYPDGTHPNDACDTIRAGYWLTALGLVGYT